jgi:hypothetical protein
MNPKEFEDFLDSGIARRQSPDRQRALSLAEEAAGKKKFLEVSLKSIPTGQMNANFIVDSCYDIIMELVRAKMLLDGFNSGNSHEAEVSYMARLGFPRTEVAFMNEVRYYRNGTKYYGTVLSREYAEKVLRFMDGAHPLLERMLRKGAGRKP